MAEHHDQTLPRARRFQRAPHCFLRRGGETRPALPGANVSEECYHGGCRIDRIASITIYGQIDTAGTQRGDQRVARWGWIRSTDVVVHDHDVPRLRQARHDSAEGVDDLLRQLDRPSAVVARRTIGFLGELGPASPAAPALERMLNGLRAEDGG